MDVTIVQDYNDLGVHIDSKWNWSINSSDHMQYRYNYAVLPMYLRPDKHFHEKKSYLMTTDHFVLLYICHDGGG